MSRTRNVRIAIFNGSCVKQREVCWLCNVTASCDKRSWISNPSTPNTKRMTLPIQRTPGPAHRPYIRSARSAAEQRRHFRFAIGPPRTYADCAALPKCSTELGAICPLLKASKFSYRWQTARCICVNNFCLHNREIVLKTTSGCRPTVHVVSHRKSHPIVYSSIQATRDVIKNNSILWNTGFAKPLNSSITFRVIQGH